MPKNGMGFYFAAIFIIACNGLGNDGTFKLWETVVSLIQLQGLSYGYLARLI